MPLRLECGRQADAYATTIREDDESRSAVTDIRGYKWLGLPSACLHRRRTTTISHPFESAWAHSLKFEPFQLGHQLAIGMIKPDG